MNRHSLASSSTRPAQAGTQQQQQQGCRQHQPMQLTRAGGGARQQAALHSSTGAAATCRALRTPGVLTRLGRAVRAAAVAVLGVCLASPAAAEAGVLQQHARTPQRREQAAGMAARNSLLCAVCRVPRGSCHLDLCQAQEGAGEARKQRRQLALHHVAQLLPPAAQQLAVLLVRCQDLRCATRNHTGDAPQFARSGCAGARCRCMRLLRV